jgi:hypothetical protein
VKLSCRFSAKQISNTKPGELVAIPNDATFDLAVVIGRNIEEDSLIVAVLQSADTSRLPHITWVADHLDCASYGFDWMIELSADLSDDQDSLQTGAAFVAEDGAYIRLGNDPERPAVVGGMALNLSTLEDGNPENSFVARSWRVWLSEEDRKDGLGTPLIGFPRVKLSAELDPREQ